MRRYIALATAAVLALALAPVGAAEASHEVGHAELVVDITKPSGNLSGTVAVEVQITENYPTRLIKEYWVRLEPAGGGAPVGVFCSEVYDDGVDEGLNLAFTWNTNRHPTGNGAANCDGGNPALPTSGASAPLANGQYRVSAFVRLTNPFNTEAVTGSDAAGVGVGNAPATPTGVKLGYKASADRITVSWDANPEASYDDVAYRVEECKVDRSSKPCSSWKEVDSVFETDLAMTRTKAGTYRYRVTALRSDASGSGVVASPDAGTPQGDPTEIVVEAAEPTSSTTPPGDGGGSSSDVSSPEPQTRTVVQPTRRVQRGTPQVLQSIVENDSGYEEELPYENGDDEAAISGLPIDGNNEDGDGRLSTLVPLAGGLTLLVFALQLWYLNDRAGRALEPVAVDAYGLDDGYHDGYHDGEAFERWGD